MVTIVHAVCFSFSDYTVFEALHFTLCKLLIIARLRLAIHYRVVYAFFAPEHHVRHFRRHHLVVEGQNLL
ncbi:hypothetical protein D3C78_1451700 [compost metagenome]